MLSTGRHSQGGRRHRLRLQLGVLDIAAMTKPIEFYFDFASPYGFLAAMQIDALPRPLTWRPFLLGAVYKRFGQSPFNHR